MLKTFTVLLLARVITVLKLPYVLVKMLHTNAVVDAKDTAFE